MKEILLTQEQKALVDDVDYEFLSKFKWHACKGVQTFYAESRRAGIMHRVIMGLKYGDKKQIDHIDGNGLNNCRSNLRIATKQQNQANRSKDCSRVLTSRYKGVSWKKKERSWRVQIKSNGKKIHVGYFKNEIEAARAYDTAALKYYGEFAKLNFPQAGRKKE